jgi:hypothetical protein
MQLRFPALAGPLETPPGGAPKRSGNQVGVVYQRLLVMSSSAVIKLPSKVENRASFLDNAARAIGGLDADVARACFWDQKAAYSVA